MEQGNNATPAAKQPKMRANSVCTYTRIEGRHEWDFPGLGKVIVDPEKGSAEARHFALHYGIKQITQDKGAVSAGDNGKINPVEKFEAMREFAEIWNSGATDLRKRAAGGGGGQISWVTRALVSLGTYKDHDVSTPEKANAFVKTIADHPKLNLGGQMAKARTWLETSKIIGDEIARLRAAEVKTDFDPDAFLDGMGDGEALM